MVHRRSQRSDREKEKSFSTSTSTSQKKEEYWERFTKDMEKKLVRVTKKIWKMRRNKKSEVNETLTLNAIHNEKWLEYFKELYREEQHTPRIRTLKESNNVKMVRNRVRKTTIGQTDEHMMFEAVKSTLSGGLSIRKAASRFNISQTTLRRYIDTPVLKTKEEEFNQRNEAKVANVKRKLIKDSDKLPAVQKKNKIESSSDESEVSLSLVDSEDDIDDDREEEEQIDLHRNYLDLSDIQDVEVTNRPYQELGQNPEERQDIDEPTVQPGTSSSQQKSTSNAMETSLTTIQSTTSASSKSPEEVRLYPKAIPRKRKGGRNPGRTRILTDTPDKEAIEAEYNAREEKKRMKGKIQQVKRQITSGTEKGKVLDRNTKQKKSVFDDSSEDENESKDPFSDADSDDDAIHCFQRLVLEKNGLSASSV
ncbi:hypothetical protein RN001_007271 [Aquatica leii]|uniref:HTH psq-type domain-containing protein n=1 Tax=Aquatica leii TaxID=1421715 RepID=A0AAN7Q477_9COLE|nr:hypothetical protein RN001_007271 [Aquatica leii]